MRLSFGQQMQLAQKQVLAPRMIQSMEILQLPLMALQERIEQEMEDNPVLDQLEVDADEPEPPAEEESTSSVADTERELVVADSPNNEDDFERLLNMAENLPDDYEERSRPSLNRIEAEGDRRHDAMANMLARPESLTDYLHHQLSWFDVEDAVRIARDEGRAQQPHVARQADDLDAAPLELGVHARVVRLARQPAMVEDDRLDAARLRALEPGRRGDVADDEPDARRDLSGFDRLQDRLHVRAAPRDQDADALHRGRMLAHALGKSRRQHRFARDSEALTRRRG